MTTPKTTPIVANTITIEYITTGKCDMRGCARESLDTINVWEDKTITYYIT